MFVGKVCNFISLYWSPSQSYDVFGTFADNLELNFDTVANKNPYLIVILGFRDFNAKSSSWQKHDKTTHEGSKLEAITFQFGLRQLIQEPNHILSNSSSCTDLVFTSQLNLIMESEIHSWLHENCHHQLVYVRFNLKKWYPPPYKCNISHYRHANIDQIKRPIEQLPWEKSLRNLHINKMVCLFNKTIKNVLSNYSPHETTTCDAKDPPWINNKIKQLI